MIRSMTGFGSYKGTVGGIAVSAEIRGVNHRFFELSLRIPRGYSVFEDKIKRLVNARVERGKIDCSVQIEIPEGEDFDVTPNTAFAKKYVQAANAVAAELGIEPITDVKDLLRCADVVTVSKTAVDEERVWSVIETAVEGAVTAFIAMREEEGARLKADIISRAKTIADSVEIIEERSPQTVAEYSEKLLTRMRAAIGEIPVDEQRLLTEAAIFADKVAVAEETVRLRSHLEQLAAMLAKSEPVGRKLDFLIQEVNREANTVGSKAQDVAITRLVIGIKAEVEKIREQIQNIE